MDDKDVFLKRRRLARDYWLNVPPAMVNLDLYGFDQLVNEGLGQKCGSVGCLAGWLQTMPEFREWYKKAYGHKLNAPRSM